MKKVLTLGLAAALAMTSLAGCSKAPASSSTESTAQTAESSAEPVEIRFSWWGNEARHEATLEAIKLYEEQNPGVKIVPEYATFDGNQDKLMAQVAGGNAPDIFTCTAEWYPALYSADALYDISDKVDWSNFDEATLKSCSYKDTIYGACVSLNGYGVYYNKTVADQYGIQIPEGDYTWDDLVKLAEEVYQKSGGQVYGMTDPRTVSCALHCYGYTVLQKPEPFMWDEEKLTITAEDMTSYLKYMESMPEGCLLPPDESFNFDSFTSSPVAQGRALFEFGSVGSFSQTQSQTEDELNMVPLPVGPNGESANETRPGLILSVYKGSEVADEAAKFIDWFVNSPDAAKVLKMCRGVLPTSVQRDALLEDTSVLERSDVVIMNTMDKIMAGELHTFLPGPLGADYVKESVSKQIAQAHAFGELTAEEAGQKFMEEAEKAMTY